MTRDINMRVKCDSLEIITEDYTPDKVVDSTDELFTGMVQHLVDDHVIDQFYSGEDIILDKRRR